MTIKRIGEGLEVRDNPLIFWSFYSFFVLGGSVALFMALTLRGSGWQALLAVLIGIGNILGGVYMLRKEPASVICLDVENKTVWVKRWGIFRSSRSSYSLNDCKEARVDVSEHTDGGSVFRPVLVLKDDSTIPISFLWYQSDMASRKVIQDVNDSIGRNASR